MKYLTGTILVAAVAFLSSCGDPGPVAGDASFDERPAAVVAPSIRNTDPGLAVQVNEVFNAYLGIQMALAADKPADASVAARRLIAVVDGLPGAAFPPDQKHTYDTCIAGIRPQAQRIAATSDIEQQRTAFSPLSAGVWELMKSFGGTKPVYQVHCPMAFDDKGASWLSDKTDIKNPYFGDAMLECGTVVAEMREQNHQH